MYKILIFSLWTNYLLMLLYKVFNCILVCIKYSDYHLHRCVIKGRIHQSDAYSSRLLWLNVLDSLFLNWLLPINSALILNFLIESRNNISWLDFISYFKQNVQTNSFCAVSFHHFWKKSFHGWFNFNSKYGAKRW